jgi:hypothetical protein
MTDFTTDYLVIGAGAVGLAFTDTLLDETDAEITIVDLHGRPGGHWNDAYPFVSLHQPSAFYGVSSMPLGSGQIDTHGPNAGLNELASGAEVSGYFERVVRQRFLPSGRVRYLPMHRHAGAGAVVSLLSGETRNVRARRRIVDATYFQTSVPATHTRKFTTAPGVRCVAPNALPDLWRMGEDRPERFVILGAGKTAMDVGVWLLSSGADPDSILWVCPRDSWLLNRLNTQPGMAFFEHTIGGQVAQMRAAAEASDVDDLFARMETAGVVLRIDPTVTPKMFHFATMSTGEVEILRAIKNVVRLGRVSTITPGEMVLAQGRISVPSKSLFIDCTATAIAKRPTVPIFQDGLITPQMVRMPQPAFSAALIAKLEADDRTDAQRNALCQPIPLPDTLDQFPAVMLANLMNQLAWSQDRPLRAWIRECRLDGFGKLIAAVGAQDSDKITMLTDLRSASMAAATNIQARLLGSVCGPAAPA